jgi:hypothetical protein
MKKRSHLPLSGIVAVTLLCLAGGPPLEAAENSPEKGVKVLVAEAVSAANSLIPGRNAYRVGYLKVESTGEKFHILPGRPGGQLTEANGRAR